MDTRTKTVQVSGDALRMLFGTLIPISSTEELISIEYKNNHLTYVIKDIREEQEEEGMSILTA